MAIRPIMRELSGKKMCAGNRREVPPLPDRTLPFPKSARRRIPSSAELSIDGFWGLKTANWSVGPASETTSQPTNSWKATWRPETCHSGLCCGHTTCENLEVGGPGGSNEGKMIIFPLYPFVQPWIVLWLLEIDFWDGEERKISTTINHFQRTWSLARKKMSNAKCNSEPRRRPYNILAQW